MSKETTITDQADRPLLGHPSKEQPHLWYHWSPFSALFGSNMVHDTWAKGSHTVYVCDKYQLKRDPQVPV